MNVVELTCTPLILTPTKIYNVLIIFQMSFNDPNICGSTGLYTTTVTARYNIMYVVESTCTGTNIDPDSNFTLF